MNQVKRVLICIMLFILAAAIYIYIPQEMKSQTHLTLYGNVDIRQVDLGFRVFGKVATVCVDEGDRVEAGQILATLDQEPYSIACSKAKAVVMTLQPQLDNALHKFYRREEISAEALSEEEYDEAIFSAESLHGSYMQARADLAEKIVALNDTTLTAPSSGVIISRVREPGALASAQDTILTLSLDKPVWARAYISEPDLGKIYPGMKATLTTDSQPEIPVSAHIGFISPVAEFTPKSVETTNLRTELVYRLRIIVDNPPKTLRQGMPVTVRIDLDQQKK